MNLYFKKFWIPDNEAKKTMQRQVRSHHEASWAC